MKFKIPLSFHHRKSAAPRGYLMLLAIFFGAIFLMIIGALSGFVLSENRRETQEMGQSKGLAIAEAGLEYYRWHLAHFPTDLQDGTGHAGPYAITYDDPEGGSVGTYTLSIAGNLACNQISSVDITSVGAPSDGSGGTATLVARYAKPTVAQYSYILNSSVWAGADRIIQGPYHSNGGIRMDGTTNAPVTSSLSSWDCTSSFGCSPDTNEPGVFGAGPNSSLWSYPTPQVDFSAIAANFSTLKAVAQSSGLYFPRVSSGTSGVAAGRGYHLIFNSNGTVTVKQVTSEYNTPSIPIDNQSVTTLQNDYTYIQTETTIGTYALPANCGLIFVEDNTWIEGVIPSKVTVVAANVTNTGINPNIMLPNNITYSNPSGTSGLLAISENDVLITPNSPQNMNLNGIFVAQGGAFGRNMYTCTETGDDTRGTLTIHGTTVSNDRTGTQWSYPGSSFGCGGSSGTETSGYTTRIDAFDRQLSTNPPPFTPTISPTFEFVDWRQK
jgi:hypothetical protein